MSLKLDEINALCCQRRLRIYHRCGEFATELPTKIKSKCSSIICMDGHLAGLSSSFCAYGDCDRIGCNCDGICATNNKGTWGEAKRLFSRFYEVKLMR